MVFPAITVLHWSLLDSMLCDKNMNDVIKIDLNVKIEGVCLILVKKVKFYEKNIGLANNNGITCEPGGC